MVSHLSLIGFWLLSASNQERAGIEFRMRARDLDMGYETMFYRLLMNEKATIAAWLPVMT